MNQIKYKMALTAFNSLALYLGVTNPKTNSKTNITNSTKVWMHY